MGKKGKDSSPLRDSQQVDASEGLNAAGEGISRRNFVKRGSGFLLVSSVGCGDGTNPTATGTFRLTLTGLHASAASGGVATVTPTGGGTVVTVNIPAAGEQSASVPVGTYSVTYTPPTGHQLAAGQTVPPQVTITEGETTAVALTLVSIGNVQVTVTGLTGSPPNGGSASAQRTDAAGTAIPISISSGGTGTASNVPTGTYTVTYTPPGGFNVSSANPVTGVVVGVGATGNATFSVAGTPTAGTVHVTVTGLTGASTGGSVSARLTNNTGSTFNANLTNPASGTSTADLTSMPVGSYNVTYTLPTGYQLQAGQSNPQVAAVTAGGTTNTNFAAEAQPVGGTAEPVYIPATDKLIVQDSFDGYTSVSGGAGSFTQRYPAFRTLGLNDETLPIGSVVTLVTGRNGTGQAIRLAYGNPGGASDIIVGTENRLNSIGSWNGTLPQQAAPYNHFYFTTWIRFSPGANPAAFNDSGVKGVMIFHNGSQRYQHSPHTLKDYNGNRYAQTRWDVGPPHPPNSTTGLNHWKTPSGEAPLFSTYTDGNYHRFTVEIYAAHPSGLKGERWWLDGVLVFDNVGNVGNLAWGADYTYNNPVVYWMVFGNYVVASVAQNSPFFTVDFDDWIAWTN